MEQDSTDAVELEVAKAPELDDSGSSGTQEASTEKPADLSTDANLTVGQPIEETVRGLAASNSRSFGGEVGAAMVAGSFTQMTHQLGEVKLELRLERNKHEATRAELNDAIVENAKLEGKLTSAENEKAIRNVSLVAGTVMAGFGIDQVRSGSHYLGGALIVFGVLMVVVGLFSVGSKKGGK